MRVANLASNAEIARDDSGPRRLPCRPKARPTKPLGVVAQVRMAARREHRLAASLGAIGGGFFPVASYVLVHDEVGEGATWRRVVAGLLVLGGLLFSAPKVLSWMRMALGSTVEAIGAVVLLEGILVAARTQWLGYAALGLLVTINATATACRLAIGDRS